MIVPNWREKLKTFRKKKSLTQSEIADTMGISQQTVVNWEKEKGTNPSIDELYKYTKILGITMDSLFSEAVTPLPNSDIDEIKRLAQLPMLSGRESGETKGGKGDEWAESMEERVRKLEEIWHKSG